MVILRAEAGGEGEAVDRRLGRQPAVPRFLFHLGEQIEQHGLLQSQAARIARIGIGGELEGALSLEGRDGGELAVGLLDRELRAVLAVAGKIPLAVIECIHRAANLHPVAGFAGGDFDLHLRPIAQVHPIRRVLLPITAANRFCPAEGQFRAAAVGHLHKHIARLREHAVKRQVAFLVDAHLHLFLVGGEQQAIDVAFSSGRGLLAGGERDGGNAGLQIGVGIVPFPHDVLRGAPAPRVLGLELLTEGPNLQILSRAVQSIQCCLAILLHLYAELRFKPICRLVPHEHEIPPRLWHPHANCRRALRLFGCPKIRLPAQERIGERRRIIILPPRFGRPRVISGRKFLRFDQHVAIGLRGN